MGISEIEQEFRASWTCYDPSRYAHFLARVSEAERIELLCRLLTVELEFSFQAPKPLDSKATKIAGEDDSEDRVRPTLQLFLLRFPELKREPEYIIRLSIIEYASRLRHDAIPPNPDSYLPLVEHSHERLFRLLRLTENKLLFVRRTDPAPIDVKHSDLTVRDSDSSDSMVQDQPSVNLGCFILTRVIGNGGMGVVYEAIDLRNAVQVAVKIMRRGDPFSIYQFNEEFTWLSKLNHPNLVRLFDTFSESHTRYFSMELVEGKDIRKWFQKVKTKRHNDPWQELLHVLHQTASAIHFLHEEGVIHCDIKPSNLLITRRKRAVLLDLGLALREGADRTTVSNLVGTLQYMSPQVIEGDKPDRASDWYSFGILMYEVVTDSYPPVKVNLDADDVQEKYTFNEHVFNEQLLSVDPPIAALIRDLLSPKASDRPSGSQILRRLGGTDVVTVPSINEDRIIGRDDILANIRVAYEQSKLHPATVILYGDSGFGKSSLIEHWQTTCVEEDTLSVSVECLRQNHTPLRLLNSVVQELAETLSKRHDGSWRQSLETHSDSISHVFPQIYQLLNEELVTQNRATNTDDDKRNQAINHLCDWLTDISKQEMLVITIDNAQWADVESLQLLSKLVEQPAFNGFLVLVEDNHESNLAELFENDAYPRSEGAYSTCETISVGPLKMEDAIQVVNHFAEQMELTLNEDIATNIASRSQGSTFLIEQLFATYAHFVRESDGTDEEWLNQVPEGNIRQRFSLLPSQSEIVLQYLAVAGQKLYFYQLEMASRIMGPKLQNTLSALNHQGWIRSESSSMDIGFTISDLARRVILDSLPPDRIHRRNYRLARMLSSEVPPPWARIAFHYSASGHFRQAATCYWEAARAAFKKSQFVEALEYVRKANHEDADRTPTEQTHVDRLEADCLAATGRSKEAAEQYHKLSQAADLNADQVRALEFLAGEQWIRSGELEQGLGTLRAKMREEDLAGKMPDRLHQRLLQIKGLALLFRIGPNRIVVEDLEPFTDLERCLNRLAFMTSFLDNRLGPNLILALYQRALKKGTLFDRAIAILNFAVLVRLSDPKLRRTANEWLRLGLRFARESRNPIARGWARNCMYVWRLQQGRPFMAIRHAVAARRWFWRDPKDLFWETQFLASSMLGQYWHSGQLKKLRSETLALRANTGQLKKGMTQFFCHIGASQWSDLVADDVRGSQQGIAKGRNSIGSQTFQSPRFFLWHSEVIQLLYEGRGSDARALTLMHWRELENSYIFSTKHYHWLALWMRMCANLVCLRERSEKRSALRHDALHCIKKVRKLRQPAFVAYGEAYSLVLDVELGKVSPRDRWDAAVSALHKSSHHLTASVLDIHKRLAHEPETQGNENRLFEFLLQEGCVNPRRLLDIILPLPSKSKFES